MSDWTKPAIEGAILAVGLMAYGLLAYGYIHWDQMAAAVSAGIIFGIARNRERLHRS